MKEFTSIIQIKKYYEQKEKSELIAKKNYYAWRTKMVLGKTGILKKYEKKLETYERNVRLKNQKQMEKAIKNFFSRKRFVTVSSLL